MEYDFTRLSLLVCFSFIGGIGRKKFKLDLGRIKESYYLKVRILNFLIFKSLIWFKETASEFLMYKMKKGEKWLQYLKSVELHNVTKKLERILF